MNILVLNAGSSSLKYQLFDIEKAKVLVKGIVEKIGASDSFWEYEVDGEKEHIDQVINTHKDALQIIINEVLKSVVSSLNSIQAIGHRVVHGGEYFKNPVLITDDVILKISECSDLAPLHNPANLQTILACKDLISDAKQVAVFDTSFHQTMTPAHYLYALPYEYYEKYKIRRYGFHGTSHQFVFNKLIENGELKMENSKVITCHVGNGVSITAIQDGKVIETSMGMTPMEGAMMGARAGNVDPGVFTFLARKEHLDVDQIEDILNKKSGLLGVSGVSNDMRDVLDGYKKQDARCMLALEMYINSIVKYIGSYVALMNGVDAIVLTAGVMERSPVVRKLLMEKLARLGIQLDEEVNDFSTEERVISTKNSRVLVMVIPTNEELIIAQETYRLIV